MVLLASLFPVILVALVTTLVLSPLAARLARRFGWVDVPGSEPHKQHGVPTPQAGGPVLGVGILACYLILRPAADPAVVGILIGAVLVAVGGMIDDRVGLSPPVKLGIQAAAALAMIGFGVRVHVTQTEGIDLALTLLWVVGMVNAFNFVDSMDGLALGLAGIAAAFFMLVSIDSAQPVLAVLSAAVLGAAVGGFVYNASPARMFLGDSGAQLLGCVLAGIGIAYTPAGAGLPQAVSWFTPILVLGVPIFDAVLVVFSRLRAGRPIYHAARDHAYHRLVGLGLEPNRAVVGMHLAGVLLGLLAFIALGAGALLANLLFAAVVAGGILLVGLLVARPGEGRLAE